MMNTPNVSVKWKKIAVIVAGMCGLSTLSFNCAPTLFESSKSSGGSVFDTFSVYEATNAPLTLLTAEQTYQSMLNVTGQSVAPVSRTEYLARFGTMASTPNLGNMTSPLMLASTSLAGDICNNLITAEAPAGATRKYFVNVNFNAGPDVNTFNSSIAAMAEGFWGRRINAEEVSILNSFYSDLTTGVTANAALTRAVMLGSCAAMLSSFDSLVY